MMPIGVDTVEHKVIAVRRDAKAGVLSDRVESVAKMSSKRVKFDLRKFGKAKIVKVKWRRLDCQRTSVAGRAKCCDKKTGRGEVPVNRD